MASVFLFFALFLTLKTKMLLFFKKMSLFCCRLMVLFPTFVKNIIFK